jgi:hypothetical protein
MNFFIILSATNDIKIKYITQTVIKKSLALTSG